MIDTGKYQGHTPAPWDSLVCATTGKKWIIDGPEDSAWKTIALVEGIGENDVGWINMWLMADAPLLLAEVKRLREENERLHEAIRGCDSMKCTWLHEGTYKEMTTPKVMKND